MSRPARRSPTKRLGLQSLKKDLFQRLRLNQYAAASEVSELIRNVQSDELDPIVAEMAQLHRLLKPLEKKKKDINDQIFMAASLRSPIRKLPQDILREIFSHFSKNIDATRLIDCPAVDLACVCSYWRDTALVQKSLWLNIRINLQKDDVLDDRVQTSLELMITRSGDLGVSLSLDDRRDWDLEFGMDKVELEMHDQESKRIVRFITKHSLRWRSISVPWSYLQLPERSSFDGPWPLLESLSLPPPHCDIFEEGPLNLSFKVAPKLHKIYYHAAIDKLVLIPWSQILWLHIYDGTPVCILEAILRCPSLLKQVRVSTFCLGQPGPLPEVTLPNCNHLLLDLNYGDDIAVESLLNALTLPTMTSITLSGPEPQREAYGQWSMPVFCTLVTRSICQVTFLQLDSLWLCLSTVSQILEALPSLIHLRFIGPHRGPRQSLAILPSSIMSLMNEDFIKLLNANATDGPPVLPHLEKIHLSIIPEAHENVWSLLQEFISMVESRWSRSSSESLKGVACLRSVFLEVDLDYKIRFARDKVQALKEEGLEINISFAITEQFSDYEEWEI